MADGYGKRLHGHDSNDLTDNSRGRETNLVDWLGVGDMIAIATEQVAAPVEGMHRAISGRRIGSTDPLIGSENRTVDGLTASIYQTVRLGGLAVGSTISAASEFASEHVTLPPVWETTGGRYAQSIFNAVWGDKLEDNESPLRIRLGIRDLDGIPVPITQISLRGAFPDATGRLVVMLHGFGETERCWRFDDSTALVAGLEADGFTVLGLRYNTGRSIADNGSDLADLLEAVHTLWPVSVDEYALIGHSMGGLVAQSAVMNAQSSAYRWAGVATHIVAIGAPHLGTPIEKGVQGISEGLGLFNETRPLGTFLESRSAGIKNLRYGVNHRPDGVKYHIIAGAISREPSNPLGFLLGDLVVRISSAIGRSRQHQAASSNVLIVGGQSHANLLHDPEVISHTRRWLAPGL